MIFRELCERAKGRLRLMMDTKEPSHGEAFYREMESAMKDNGLLESAYFIGTEESRAHFKGKARLSATFAELQKYAAKGEPVDRLYFLFEWGNLPLQRRRSAQARRGGYRAAAWFGCDRIPNRFRLRSNIQAPIE